jgi:hypothetical protein
MAIVQRGSRDGSPIRPGRATFSPGRRKKVPQRRCSGRSRPISRVLSWTTIHLGYASPCISSDLPGSLCGPHVRSDLATRLRASLFGLAPGGVCRAAECYHRRGALLPHPFTLTGDGFETVPKGDCPVFHHLGGLLSVALSVDSRPPGVTWRLALGARTFLHAFAQRLPGRLRRAWWGLDLSDASGFPLSEAEICWPVRPLARRGPNASHP